MLHIFYILWLASIVSAGVPCGYVAYKSWQLRKRHRVFRYFGLVKFALFVSTCNGIYTLVDILHANGLVVFDDMPILTYRSLICQTLLSLTLWLLALFLFNKINGDTFRKEN